MASSSSSPSPSSLPDPSAPHVQKQALQLAAAVGFYRLDRGGSQVILPVRSNRREWGMLAQYARDEGVPTTLCNVIANQGNSGNLVHLNFYLDLSKRLEEARSSLPYLTVEIGRWGKAANKLFKKLDGTPYQALIERVPELPAELVAKIKAELGEEGNWSITLFTLIHYRLRRGPNPARLAEVALNLTQDGGCPDKWLRFVQLAKVAGVPKGLRLKIVREGRAWGYSPLLDTYLASLAEGRKESRSPPILTHPPILTLSPFPPVLTLPPGSTGDLYYNQEMVGEERDIELGRIKDAIYANGGQIFRHPYLTKEWARFGRQLYIQGVPHEVLVEIVEGKLKELAYYLQQLGLDSAHFGSSSSSKQEMIAQDERDLARLISDLFRDWKIEQGGSVPSGDAVGPWKKLSEIFDNFYVPHLVISKIEREAIGPHSRLITLNHYLQLAGQPPETIPASEMVEEGGHHPPSHHFPLRYHPASKDGVVELYRDGFITEGQLHWATKRLIHRPGFPVLLLVVRCPDGVIHARPTINIIKDEADLDQLREEMPRAIYLEALGYIHEGGTVYIRFNPNQDERPATIARISSCHGGNAQPWSLRQPALDRLGIFPDGESEGLAIEVISEDQLYAASQYLTPEESATFGRYLEEGRFGEVLPISYSGSPYIRLFS